MSAAARSVTAVAAALALGASPAAAPRAQPTDPTTPAAPAQCNVHESVTRLGQWFDPSHVLTAGAPMQDILAPSSTTHPPVAMRLLLRAQAVGDGRWRLVIRDARQRTLVVLAAEDFGGPQDQGRERWTGILRAPRVIFDLRDADPTVRIQVLSGVALPASGEGVSFISFSLASTKASMGVRTQLDSSLGTGAFRRG